MTFVRFWGEYGTLKTCVCVCVARVLADDSIDLEDVPATLVYGDPSAPAKNAVDSDQETDDGGEVGGNDVPQTLILPESVDVDSPGIASECVFFLCLTACFWWWSCPCFIRFVYNCE